MIELVFPDGAARSYPQGTTGRQVAESIAPSLAKRAALVKLDGETLDLSRPLNKGGAFQILTRDDPESLFTIRHDVAHVLAEAVQSLFPGTQVTIGPPIEDGFYYDFAREEPFSTEDFPKIEAKMREIVDRGAPFERSVMDRNEAIAFFEAKGEKYKAELIRDLPETEEISLYSQGEWIDLCRGPHFPTTRHAGKAFKLTKLAGAYWRGDHRNAQLQRIYGTAWANDKDLEEHLAGSRRRRNATTAASAAPWTCSTSRKRAGAWCSGTRTAGPSTARWKATCAAGSRRPATRRSGRPRCSTAPCGRSPATGSCTGRTCSWLRPSRARPWR
jgi:threonyl-tRNA synthetase